MFTIIYLLFINWCRCCKLLQFWDTISIFSQAYHMEWIWHLTCVYTHHSYIYFVSFQQ